MKVEYVSGNDESLRNTLMGKEFYYDGSKYWTSGQYYFWDSSVYDESNNGVFGLYDKDDKKVAQVTVSYQGGRKKKAQNPKRTSKKTPEGRVIYEGPRGGKYIRKAGKYVRLA